MSGSFNEIDVPPTLVSFAVDVAKEKEIITPELKAAGNRLVLFRIEKDAYDLPVYEQVMKLYDAVHKLIQAGVIISAYALDGKGLAAAVSKMAFGNQLGVTLEGSVTEEILFAPGFGDLVAEVRPERADEVKEALCAAELQQACSRSAVSMQKRYSFMRTAKRVCGSRWRKRSWRGREHWKRYSQPV